MILSGISVETKNNQKIANKNTSTPDNDFLSVLLASKETARNKNKSYDLSHLATLATSPTTKELAKKQEKNLSVDLSTIKADYVDYASKKKKKAETLSRIVTLPDGTRLLLVTIEINGRTIQLSMKLSGDTPEKNGIIEESAKENPNKPFVPEEDSIAADDALLNSGMGLDMT